MLCVGAALLRKTVVFRKICQEYQLEELCEHFISEKLLETIL